MCRWIRTLAKRFALYLHGRFASRRQCGQQHQGPKVRVPRRTVKPSLETLGERVMPSATPFPGSSLTPDTPNTAAQLTELVTVVQNEVSSIEAAISQEVAQVMGYVLQRWETLLGVEPTTPSQPPAGSRSGSGSGTMMTAHNASNQQAQVSVLQSGSGTGSGANTNVQEAASTRTIGGNSSKQGIKPLVGSGSGSSGGGGGGGGGSIGSAWVNGQVWLDNNGDGSMDNGEAGFQGITVNLDDSSGNVLMTTTTDASGNYSFFVDGVPGEYEIQVVIPSGDQATIQGASSNINSFGYSPPFALAAGQVFNAKPAGIRSMQVTTTQDDANAAIPNQVTLRDAIETGQNGGGNTVTFQAGVSGTISLQAKLPDLSQEVTIAGPGASNLTVQGNANAGNMYSVFVVKAGISANISSLTIMGGYNADGGGIDNFGSLGIVHDIIQYNTATSFGGGICNEQDTGELYLEDDIIHDNQAEVGGGIANFNSITGPLDIPSVISNNTAVRKGGGIFTNGSVNLNDIQIASNNVNMQTGQGGGVFNQAGTINLAQGTIDSNYADEGGGLFNIATTTLSGVSVQYNKAAKGGGMSLDQFSTTTFNGVTVSGNVLLGDGDIAPGIGFYAGATMNKNSLTDNDDPGGDPVLY